MTEEEQITEEQLRNMTPEQLKEFQKKNCIFCNLIAGKIQSKKIYEDEKTLAILDINPANPGHILLMPKEHYTIMPQMPDFEVGYLFMVAKSLSFSSLKALKAEGTNIFVANGVAAGQRSPHLMIHIIPRKTNDGIANFGMTRKKISREELKPLQKKMIEKLSATLPENKAEFLENNEDVFEMKPAAEPKPIPKKKEDIMIQKKQEIPEKEEQTEQTKESSGLSLDDIAKVLGRR